MRLIKIQPKSLEAVPNAQIEKLRFHLDVSMSLSFLDSGCLAASILDQAAFIIKESAENLALLAEAREAAFTFECIKRQEFPAVKMTFNFAGNIAKPYAVSVFFGIESEEDMELLAALARQDYFGIIFLSTQIEYARRVNLTPEDWKRISSVLDEAAA
ncbi:MAG: hypothetical protein ACT4NX_03955 [Deltaproteobacteria bacterium]